MKSPLFATRRPELSPPRRVTQSSSRDPMHQSPLGKSPLNQMLGGSQAKLGGDAGRSVSPSCSRGHLSSFGGSAKKQQGCANTDGGKTRRCSPVPFELDDPGACTRSVPGNRCIAKPEPRKCEYYQAAKSPRCRVTTTKDNDSRCVVTSKGRCGLAANSPRKASKKGLSKPKKLERSTSAPVLRTGGYVFY